MWAKVRNGFERAYDMYTREQFLDYITTAYIVKLADLELERKEKEGINDDKLCSQ